MKFSFEFLCRDFKISTQDFLEGVQDFCKCWVFLIGSCDMYCVVRFILMYDIILLYYWPTEGYVQV